LGIYRKRSEAIMEREKIMSQKLFPTILIVLSICAGIVCAVKGDVRHAVYWFSAAALNISVTW